MSTRYSRWAMWGCLSLAFLSVLLFAGYALMLMKTPGVLPAAEKLARCQNQLQEVSAALGRYYADKNHLPASLDELYPTYLVESTNLRCPADSSKSASSSYVMVPKATWGSGQEIVVYCPHHPAPPAIQRMAGKRQLRLVPVILQDGTVGQRAMPAASLPLPVSPR